MAEQFGEMFDTAMRLQKSEYRIVYDKTTLTYGVAEMLYYKGDGGAETRAREIHNPSGFYIYQDLQTHKNKIAAAFKKPVLVFDDAKEEWVEKPQSEVT